MTPDSHRLLAAISPETYCVPAKRREIRRVLDEALKHGDPLAVRRAAELAEPMPANDVALEELLPRNAFDPMALRHPLEQHSYSCDSMEQSLEAFYFTLLDYLESHGWEVTKLVDHLSSATGSGFGGDLSRRAMKSQQEAVRLLEASQELVEKMLRRVEPIKDMERQLAALSAGGMQPIPNLQSPTQPDSVASSEADPGGENPSRLTFSADEVRARLDLQRRQLRSQMDLLRLQAHWLQPWLRSAEELRERGSHRADLVTAFNTALLDVVLLARRKLPIEELIHDGELPRFLTRTRHRNYTPAVLIELRFRAVPRRVTTGTHVLRGRVEVVLTSYALHDSEVATLRRELERDAVGQLLSAVGFGSPAAVETILKNIERLLAPVNEANEKLEPADSNPFVALLSLFRDLWRWLFSGTTEAGDDFAPDRPHERVLRSQSVIHSRHDCRELFQAAKLLTRGV